jgi:hypothetical protein
MLLQHFLMILSARKLLYACSGWYEGCSMINQLKYRSQHTHMPGKYNDVFDGSHYCGLLDMQVKVQGETLGDNYFSYLHDIAFGDHPMGFR